jgi:hypothetical protein
MDRMASDRAALAEVMALGKMMRVAATAAEMAAPEVPGGCGRKRGGGKNQSRCEGRQGKTLKHADLL